MKKIMIIDGGPRKNFNTASMLQKFAEGIQSVSSDVDVKTIRLYDMDYKGCMSCMVCKIKGKASNICKFKDALTPIFGRDFPGRRHGIGFPYLFRSNHWADASVLRAFGISMAFL